VYGVAVLDCHGRIADQAVLRALGWTPGVGLDISATRDLLTVRARVDGAAGRSGVTPQGHVRVPAPVRHICGLRPGDRVLLAADPSSGVLRVFPPATVDALLPALTYNPDDDQNHPSNPADMNTTGGGKR
jgi:bifunctional DNA-binding transcriptional regulator/antitoxin component of YhaV-PrlF toxin-antitoxin module